MPTLSELIIKVGANTTGLERGFGEAQRQINALVRKTRPLAQDFTAVGKAVGGAGLAIGAGLGHAVSVAATFESTMSDVSALVDDGGKSLSGFSALALEMGANTKYSATEAGQGIAELIKAGVSATDVMGGGLAGALALAAAGDISVAEAAETASNALNVFHLAGSQTAHVADLLAAAANKSATDVRGMGMAFNQSASVAANLGVPIETLTGTLAMFAQSGLKGSDAGTSFKQMLLHLNPQSDKAAALMEQLGLKFFDSQGQFIGVAGVAELLHTKLGGLTQEQRQSALATIFGSDAIRAATELYKAGEAGVTEWTGKVNDAGAAARIAAERQNNLKGSLEQLGGAVETAEISIGSALVPGIRTLTEAVQGGVNWFNQLSPAMQSTVAVSGAVASGLGIVSGGMLLLIGQIPQIVQGIGAVKTVMNAAAAAMPTFAAAGAAAMGGVKAGAAGLAGVLGPLPQVVLGIGAAFLGWQIGRLIGEMIGLNRELKITHAIGDQIIEQNSKLAAKYSLLVTQGHAVAAVSSLIELADKNQSLSKDELLGKYRSLILEMDKGGEAGEKAWQTFAKLYDQEREHVAQLGTATTATQTHTTAAQAMTRSLELFGDQAEVATQETAELGATTSAVAATATTEVGGLSTAWAEPPQQIGAAEQAVQGFAATHSQAMQSASAELDAYAEKARVTLSIIEDTSRRAASPNMMNLGGFSGMQSGGWNFGDAFGVFDNRDLLSKYNFADQEIMAKKAMMGQLAGAGVGMSSSVEAMMNQLWQQFGSGARFSGDQLKALGGNVPGMATGGDVLRGGLAMVGEAGPELMSMPRGARVEPLGGGGGTVINNYYITVQGTVVGEDDIWRIARNGGLQHRRSNRSARLS